MKATKSVTVLKEKGLLLPPIEVARYRKISLLCNAEGIAYLKQMRWLLISPCCECCQCVRRLKPRQIGMRGASRKPIQCYYVCMGSWKKVTLQYINESINSRENSEEMIDELRPSLNFGLISLSNGSDRAVWVASAACPSSNPDLAIFRSWDKRCSSNDNSSEINAALKKESFARVTSLFKAVLCGWGHLLVFAYCGAVMESRRRWWRWHHWQFRRRLRRLAAEDPGPNRGPAVGILRRGGHVATSVLHTLEIVQHHGLDDGLGIIETFSAKRCVHTRTENLRSN